MSELEGRPLVSALVPTRNRPDLVCRAVESVLNQSYRDLELIVVVDGPDEQTAMSLRQFECDRVRIIELSENVGSSEARNIGARAARGKYIALLDDDDEWLPEKIDAQVRVAEAHPNNDILLASTYYIRSPGRRDVVRPKRLPRRGEDLSEYAFDAFCGFNTSTYLCRKDLFLRVPFSDTVACLDDVDWFLRIVRQQSVPLIVVEKPLSIYHNPADRSTITTRSNWQDWQTYSRNCPSLMTKRAHDLCVARGVRRTEKGMKGLISRSCLFREMFRFGIPNLRTLALFFLFSCNDGQIKRSRVRRHDPG